MIPQLRDRGGISASRDRIDARQWPAWALLALSVHLTGASSTGHGQDADAEYSRFLSAAESYAVTDERSGTTLELHPESLLQWTNPVRDQERGSVFVWLNQGRPEVIGSVFTYQHNGKVFDKVEVHSLSSRSLRMTHEGATIWTPQPGLEWQTPAFSSPPSRNERQRLVQMRQIARGYTVRLTDPNGEVTDLRFLAQPLFRYQAREAGVIDGAIFSFAVATDPEALLIIEASDGGTAPEWRCAFARFHYWPLEALSSRGEVIWSAGHDRSQATHRIGDESQFKKSYVSFRPSVEPVRTVQP